MILRLSQHPDGTTTEEWPRAHRVALDGRIGGTVGISESWGLSGQIGRYIAHATAKDEATGAKASWMPSGSTGAVGLWFRI